MQSNGHLAGLATLHGSMVLLVLLHLCQLVLSSVCSYIEEGKMIACSVALTYHWLTFRLSHDDVP